MNKKRSNVTTGADEFQRGPKPKYREDRFDYRDEYYLRSNKNDVSRRERVNNGKKQQTQSQNKYGSYYEQRSSAYSKRIVSQSNTKEDEHHLERKCDNCRWKTLVSESTEFNCSVCQKNYVICDYCYDEYQENQENEDCSSDEERNEEMRCVYCWSNKTLTDICVKSLKSFGFAPGKNGQNKIPISSLTKEKVKRLANLRVIQKTLVYVIGLAPDIAQESTLKSLDFFGQYGKIEKIVINTNNIYNGSRGGPSYSAYMTFSNPRDSAIAILSVDQFIYNERLIRASFGTSKFCQFFLGGQKCTNKDCLYLHELRSDLEAYTKEDMQNNKFIFQEQQKIAIKLSKALEISQQEFQAINLKSNQKLKEAYSKNPKFSHEPVLPKSEIIYDKEFHFLDETLNQKHQRKLEKLEKKQEEPIEEKQFIAPIQLNNQKDFSHDQIDRSLSKIRKPEVKQPPVVVANQSIFSDKFQIVDPKNDLERRGVPEESTRNLPQKIDNYFKRSSAGSRFQQNPAQRQNKHQQSAQQPITETTSADARKKKFQENEHQTAEIKSYGDIMETLSKTPSISDQQLAHLQAAAKQFMISPHLFQKKKESRFKFAHSVDPLKNIPKVEDDEEIQVPKNIQELIMRGIRTMSNSLSNVNKSSVKSTAAQEAQEEAEGGIKIITLNRLLEQQPMELKELREIWYTKKELKDKELDSPKNCNSIREKQ